MKNPSRVENSPRLVLGAATAADLMMPNPVSIDADATVKEATAFLTDKGFSAAPVINSAGRPIGVLSQSDIVVHDREKVDYIATSPDYYQRADLGARLPKTLPSGFEVVDVDRARVSEIMTPVVFSVTPEMPAAQVIEEMLALKIHRLFVVGDDGVLVGVISTTDVLRQLHPEQSPGK